MIEHKVTFISDGLKLAGVIGLPDDIKAGERRPAMIVHHGFGSTKDASNVTTPCAMMTALGYVTFRFDFRGCGDSEGEAGRLICLEQVSDSRHALTLLQGHPHIDPARIGVMGSSFGAAVAVYAAGIDQRYGACISASGWGNGAKKFEAQHSAPGAFEKFMKMLADGRAHRDKTGTSLMVSRYDIVPIPAKLRGHVIEKSVMMMPVETAQSMYDFMAENMVCHIAPRPCLFLHSAVDSVTPTQQSIDMFTRARGPAELHLFSGTDHFMFAEDNTRVHEVVTTWLNTFFPVHGAPLAAPHH
jgi:uncharacterized protein